MSVADSVGDGGFRLEPWGDGWLVGRFAALEALGAPHLVTTRRGPDVQQVRHNTGAAAQRIAESLGLSEIAYLEQMHGGDALVCEKGGLAGRGDGLVTAAADVGVLGKSADCPTVLIADKRRRAVGFAHASWRATVAGIVPAVVKRTLDLGCSPADLVACICPSVGPECYEVGEEVREAALRGIGPHAAAFFHPGPRGRDHFDLWAANVDALIRAGLTQANAHLASICTLCRNDLFPSHRREGEPAGRFAAVIGVPG
jgi:YfiH family protein